MEYRILGNTQLTVSKLCFGSLVMGPLQRNLSVAEGAEIMAYAFSNGVNFVDTAELYDTYPYIRAAAKLAGSYPVVATKCYAYNSETARQSIERARAGLDLDVIDIFMLHEQESKYTLDGHREALETFAEAKLKGIIRAVGVSTHYIEVVRAVTGMPEIDIVHPIVNVAGLGIQDGGADDMLRAVETAHSSGKGVYAMKIFGGGNLLKDYLKCLEYVAGRPFIDSIAIGMQSRGEVDMNIAALDGKLPDKTAVAEHVLKEKALHIDRWCTGCGSCAEKCGQGALTVNPIGIAEVAPHRCILCGYCAAACPEFAIKIN
jgi:aryl-alcohol dehydrogenase-like predicted oxidoreductase